MKIGLISDIHAHYDDLQTALRIFKSIGVDTIVCAGDLVEKGDDGDAVIALFQTVNIPCVLGNHDEVAADNQQWMKDHMDLSHPKSQKALLTSESLSYLGQLPRQLNFTWEGEHVLLVHGSPASNTEYLPATTPRERFLNHTQWTEADIIISGHTHRPMHVLVDGVHFINPGSVKPGKVVSSHTCAVLTLPQKLFVVYRLKDGKQETFPPQIPTI